MLVLTLTKDECIKIGESITLVAPDSNRSSQIKVGIDAPKDTPIKREPNPYRK